MERSTGSNLGLGKRTEFDGGNVIPEGERLEGTWKETWGKVKKVTKKETESNRKDSYRKKELQSELYRKKYDECNMWLKQRLKPRKTGAIMNLQERMVQKMLEIRVRKVSTGLTCADDKCELCGDHRETVDHLLAGCKLLAENGYFTRHNRTLMILAVQWAKEFELIDTQTK